MTSPPFSTRVERATAAMQELLYESDTTCVSRVAGTVPGEAVVLKVYKGAAAKFRLRTERRLLQQLAATPGVVQLAPGAGTPEALAMRDCAGVPLSQCMAGRPLAMERVLALAPQLARILAAVHRQGVVHRDINPANILLTPAGEPVLIDFDLAVSAARPAEPAGQAQLVGTLAYVAPEQTGRTGRGVDSRADLYALGVTLYEMATGRVPFDTRDALGLVHDHLARQPVPPAEREPGVPAGFSRIVMRLLAKAPEQRYEQLEQRVQERTREVRRMQAQLVSTARRAGRAEIANNVLHNVGNVLNSINVSASLVRSTIDNSRIDGLRKAVELMNELDRGSADFMGRDPRGKALLAYLNELVTVLQAEREGAFGELERLSRSVEHVTHVVATQQSHAGPSSLLESVRPQDVLDEALRLAGSVVARCGATVVRRYEDVPALQLDTQRLLQILVNLIRNAAEAMQAQPQAARELTLSLAVVTSDDEGQLRIGVRDEGEGISPENLPRVFSHGFTTRETGHGFGLHSSALAAMEMGGRLSVHSDGPGKGALFTVHLPLQPVGRAPG